MFGTCKKGFSFLEILVVILLMGILTTIIIPNFRSRPAKYEREIFIAEFEGLIRLAWQQAVQTGELHRILFDVEHKMISIQKATGKKDREGKPAFEDSKDDYNKTMLKIPDFFTVRDFFINGQNEFKRERDTFKIWFFILPTGMSQEVIVNMNDVREIDDQGNEARLSLVLNPFTVRFNVYDTFQKP